MIDRQAQQAFHFHGPNRITINANTNHLAEPFTEQVTLKVTASQKNLLLKDAKKAGYSNLSIYARDMILIGLAARPFLNRSLKDLINKKF